jgi:hypothetical protein
MQRSLLKVYLCLFIDGCRFALIAARDVQSGLQESDHEEADQIVWYGAQNFIIAAGNLSKILWGTERDANETEERRARRKPLRDTLHVEDDSPLRRIKLRNDYEHFDERLEQWWNETAEPRYPDAEIGPRNWISEPADVDILRQLDPTSGDVIFWGNELNIPSVLDEIRRLLPIAKAAVQDDREDDFSIVDDWGYYGYDLDSETPEEVDRAADDQK